MEQKSLALKIQKEYQENNLENVEILSKSYFELYGWNIELLKCLISVLILQKKFTESQKYINTLSLDLNEYALGYFFKASKDFAKGDVTIAKATFKKAIRLGISPQYIESLTGFRME